jgi:hypothetical protein
MSATPHLALPASSRRAAVPESLLAMMMTVIMMQLRALDQFMSRTTETLAESRAQLLRMAHSLEDQQPSHAADLRAAASRDEG